jgi:hypothetical protein
MVHYPAGIAKDILGKIQGCFVPVDETIHDFLEGKSTYYNIM